MDLLRALTVFVHVNEDGSFAAAARRLDLAPAVVTRLVAELETHLGARLLNRTTRRLSLTDAGRAYLEDARNILLSVEKANEQARQSTGAARGHLRVLVGAAVAVHQLAEHLPRFHRDYPDVTLELHSPAVVDTMDEHYDVSILATRRKLDGGFIARQLTQVPVIMCAAPAYLKRAPKLDHPRDLPNHDALLPPSWTLPEGIALRRSSGNVDEPGEETFDLQPRKMPLLSATHPEINLAAARAGMGITGQPYYLVKDDLETGVLVRVLPEWRLPCLPIIMAMPSREYVPARTRAFINFLEEIFGQRSVIGAAPARYTTTQAAVSAA
ncbi:LysR family transcriptional regulator [Pelomonas sp. KK5]|uniref:LysR family transcriptional regulator n=1 Tax=Pelomonas sp. KK5 TaxID=1855730 RepID=UPI00097C1FF2|nr:LysR family transcriptional regulator [Pelomonas sp. KK5]